MKLFKKRKKKPELPKPLVKITKRPIRFVINKVHMVAFAGVGTYIGVLFIAGLYYLLTQTTDFMNQGWHWLVPDDTFRHDIRNVGEGLLGGVIAQGLIWNHWKIGKPKIWDKLEVKLHIPNIHDKHDVNVFQLLTTPLLVILYAVPGFLVARWLVGEIHWLHTQSLLLNMTMEQNHIPPILQRMKENFTADWPQKLMGFGAAYIFGRHVAKGVYDDVQGWFATNRIMKENQAILPGVPKKYQLLLITAKKRAFVLLPPTYQARVNDLRETGLDQNMKRKWQANVLKYSTPIVLLIAGFGWYVLNFIAYG